MSRKLGATTNRVEWTCYFLERTVVSVCLQMSSFQILHLTFVRTVHGELQANRVVSVDNVIAHVVEAAVLACDGSLDAAIRVKCSIMNHPELSTPLEETQLLARHDQDRSY